MRKKASVARDRFKLELDKESYVFTQNLRYFAFFIKAKNRIKPVKVYDNFVDNKLNIKTENYQKSGIYYFINLLNGQDYVGKSKNLSIRLNNYLNVNYLNNNKNMLICKALLDNNFNNFAVFIIDVYI